jgi:steroid delta-isomerase-like uncharacterized protein
MESAYQSIAHEWFEELWNKGRIETIDEKMDEECIAHGLSDGTGNEIRGAQNFKPFFQAFRQAFPDIHVSVEDVISAGDKTVARCRVQATHTGDSLGFPATGKPVDFSGIAIIREQNGKIIEAWNHFDFFTMYNQLGVIQPFNTEAVLPQ